MKTKNQVAAFLNSQLKNVKGMEGFVIGITSKFLDLDALADIITNDVLPSDSSGTLISLAFVSGADESQASIFLLCTGSGIHEIHSFGGEVFEYASHISFSEVDTIEVIKTGFFEPVYNLNIYQAGKKKKKGWFYSGLPKMLNYFQISTQNALLNFDKNSASNTLESSININDGSKRIKALFDQNLITKKDFDTKLKSWGLNQGS